MFNALASHFFREFRSRLEVELDGNGNSFQASGMVAQARGGAGRRQQQMISMERSQNISRGPSHHQTHYSQDRRSQHQQQQLVERGSYFGREETQEFKIDDSRYFNKIGGGTTVDYSREESPNNRNLYTSKNQTMIAEETGQLGSQYRRGIGAVSQSILKKTNIQINDQSIGGGDQNRSLSKSRTVLQQQAGTIVTKQEYQAEQMRQQNERNQKGFLRVGDIVLLTFHEKVYEGGIQPKDQKQGEGQSKLLFAKITDTPELVYKGIMCSDGVTNKGFNVVPKSTNFLNNGSSQFKKCLFRIEIAQECKYHIIKQNLDDQLDELERERQEIDVSNYDEYLKIEEKIERIESLIQANENHLTEEIKNNEYEFQMNIGKKITYGQKIQLKHLFSTQYLTLNAKKISLEHGCVSLQLSDLNEDSWFNLTPSQKIKQIGQSISYQDSFYIQNFVQSVTDKPIFFVHVNTVEIGSSGEESILEVNCSHEASRIRARLFIDYRHLLNEKMNIHSGDTIRLFHKEANGFLVVTERDVDFILPDYPDYLQKELKNMGYGANGEAGNISNQKKGTGKNDDDQDDQKAIKQEELKRSQINKIYIERNPENLFFTNSCWEIQKVKPFVGGQVMWDEYYRLKHIGTGKYLAVSNDKLELTLKDYADFFDTLFQVRKDSYRPNGPLLQDGVKTKDLMILQTQNRSFIQIAKEIEDDDQTRYEHKAQSNYHKYSQAFQAQSQIPTVCGFFAKEDVSKMAFEIHEVSYEEALIAYQGSSFFQAFQDFYGFLNMWAVIAIDEDEDSFDRHRYDYQAANATDQKLNQAVEDIEVVLNHLMRILNKAKDTSIDSYLQVQKHLAEQGILQMLIKLLELIYFKTVPLERRELPFVTAKMKKTQNYDDDDEEKAEYIARDYLDHLSEKILIIIYMLIKQNQQNCEKVTKYDYIIYTVLVRYDTNIASKIFKETFKRSQYIYGDKSAAIINSEGIDNKVIENTLETAVGSQFNSLFGNQINKWAEMLETVAWKNDHDENISRQILYLNVITMICKDAEGKGVHHYQMQAVYNILEMEANIPLRFSIQKREVDKVYVYFVRKSKETGEIFFQKNQSLREIYKANSAHGDAFDIVFDLQEISQKSEKLMPYIDYIAAVINMYSAMCLSRNHLAINKVKEIGLSFDHVLTCINNKMIHEKLKAAYIFAAKVLFVDNDPFPTVLTYRNRCYFWDAIQSAQAHRTMYNWEKNKYYNFNQNRILAQEQELSEDIVMRVRDNVYKFFQKGPSDIVEFLYAYQLKKFSKRDIDPKLVLITNYIDAATSLIECEQVDSNFIYRMLKIAALIFISYHSEETAEELEKSWLLKILKVSKTAKRCRNKIDELESKTLKMLQVICQYRLNSQVLIFLQFFRKFEEMNEDPHINTKITNFDEKFQMIFQLYQFNVDKNQTQRKIKQIKAINADADILQINEISLADEILQNEEELLKKKKRMDEEEEQAQQEFEAKRKERLLNQKYELDKFLLYLIFAKKTNRKIRNLAVNVLRTNFNQREHLMNELIKIELIISQQDQNEYQEFKFQHYRLQGLIEQMMHDDLYYLLYMSLDKEKYKISIQDIMNILKGLTSNLNSDPARLQKKQNMFRHLDIASDLINKLMKNVYYRENDHYSLFSEIMNFLFMYSYQNSNNQRNLLQHLNYLVTLTDKEIPTPKLISQIILQNKDTEEGVKFLQYLTNKVINQNIFKSALFKLLSQLANGNESSQVFILKRLVKKKRFRKRLYMDAETSKKKIDLVVALKKKIAYLATINIKSHKADIDKERVDLHLSIVEILATTAQKSLFGRMQARKLVSAEVLFDSILSESVPYKFRKVYLRLLYNVYLDDVKEDPTNMDYNSQKFYDMMQYIVYEDLKQYTFYYLGLLKKHSSEAKRDNQIEKERERVNLEIERISKADIKKRNAERPQAELENFKEMKSKLSTLRSNKPFPLIDDNDFNEYWNYLTRFKKSRGKADGLLHFIQDFYSNLRRGHGKRMSRELVEITIRIREVLMQMSDDLHKLLETYKEHLKDIESMLFVIGEAISSIPNVKSFKAGKKFNVKGGGEDVEDDEAQIITEESENEELDESKELDIRMASDKVLRIIRDNIIQRNCQIREAFDIESIQTDVVIKKFDLKSKIKEIAGTDATFEEIEKAIKFFTTFSKEQQQERKILQVEIGQEGHIKSRLDPSQIQSEYYFNFRDFEMLLKKNLSKSGYKPPHQKRERLQEEDLNLRMVDQELSRACNNDLKLYAKCFFDFFQRFKNLDELADIVDKIMSMFNNAFETNQKDIIKNFIENMMQGFVFSGERIYLMKILNMILQNYMPASFEDQEELQAVAKSRLFQLQVIMKDCKILELLLRNINQDDIGVSNEAIKLLCSMLCESNTQVQEDLLVIMKTNKDNFDFFSYIRDRLQKASDSLIKNMEKKIIEKAMQNQALDTEQGDKEREENAKYAKKDPFAVDQQQVGLYNLHQQPFYVNQNFDLENEIQKLKQQQHSNELLNILRMIQLLCDNCHQGFQDFLRNQEENSPPDHQPLTTVNVVVEVANLLIKLTNRLGKIIFTEFILYETVGQIFDTLIDFLYGPNIENQRLLGQWKKLTKAINFYLTQDMGFYAANTTEQKAKLQIMFLCSKLLLAMVESVDINFKWSIMSEMVPELSLNHLKKKMVDVFLYKIGGDEKKLRIYYSDKKCEHWRTHSFVRVNMCERDEFCQYGHLIKFDKLVISAGFNIFLFLYSFKEADQTQKYLEDFDYELKKDDLYNQYRKEFMQQLKFTTNISAAQYAELLEKNEREIKEEIERKCETLLQQMTLNAPSTKMFVQEDNKKQQNEDNFLSMGIDQGKVNGDDLDGGARGGANGNSNKIIRRSPTSQNLVKANKCSKYCCIKHAVHDSCCTKTWKALFCFSCCTCCRPKHKRNMLNQVQIENEFDDVDGMGGDGGDQDPNKELEGIKLIVDKGQGSLNQQDDFFNIKRSLNQQQKNEEVYSLRQFKLDLAIRFYISNVANIEIDYKGKLSKVMFRIPPFCTYFTMRTQRDLVYGAKRTSQQDKLEDFFVKIKLYRAEMKSLQRLARRSIFLKWLADQWNILSNVSFFMVFLINLLFVIFYKGNSSGGISLEYKDIEVFVELLGIIQAFLSFIVMAGYIQQYHGAFYQKYLDVYQVEKKKRFTDIKGSLGFAYGTENFKVSQQQQQSALLQDLASKHSKHSSSSDPKSLTGQIGSQAQDALNIARRNVLSNLQIKDKLSDIGYALDIFTKAMRIDLRHLFNVIYFFISFAGIFYHALFSVLLLDIIIKIPLLTNVVQAIVQNRKQLMYTAILLFVAIYIYSFVAFSSFRSTYLNSDNSPDDPPDVNMYCDSLLKCFTSTLNNGLRAGGGVGDVTEQLSDLNNQYWGRYIFDLTFFCIVIILLLNLIFGIIIDAFADMRDERNSVESDVKEKCFICGLSRFEFEAKNVPWFDHILKEHNVYAYLYFILYVQRKPGNECTGVEKYVKSLVLNEDPAFFPINRCIALEDQQPVEEKPEIM